MWTPRCFSLIVLVQLAWIPAPRALAAEPQARITLSQSITAGQLLDLVSSRLGINLEYSTDGTRWNRPITLRSQDGYTAGELWELAHQILETEGMTTVIAPGDRTLYRVVQLTQAFDRSAVLGDSPDPPPGYAVRSYSISHAEAEGILRGLEQIQPVLGRAVVVQPGGRGLLAGAVNRQHRLIRAYITDAEQSASSFELELAQVTHRDPPTVIASVNALLAGLPGRKPTGTIAAGPRADLILISAPEPDLQTWLGLIRQFDLPEGVETRSYAMPTYGGDSLLSLLEQVARDGRPGGSGELWRVVQNDLASTLLITATPAEHERVLGLLDQLESIPPEQRQLTRTFLVKNRNAEDLRESLSRLLGVSLGQSQGPGSASDSSNAPLNTDPTPAVARSDGLVMAVDAQLNAIIANGPPVVLDQVEALIEQLDVRQPQVLLEVILVSLSEGQSQDLGVELQAQLGTSGTLVGLGSLFGLSSVSPSSSSPAVGGTGGSVVVLDPGDFSVVVRALETISDGRSVSSAQTLVNNNEAATLSNTVQEPFATTVLDDGDSITGFGGSESAGTEISVSPQIAEGDFLVLDYDVSLSAFLGEATSDGLPPSSQSTSISSVATIPDGYSIVVGGLELLNQSDTTSKTPLLGDLPLLGNLFRNNSESSSRTRFYLFIRASIMRSPGFERLRYLSDVQAEEAGVDTGWPKVEPLIIR